MKFSTIALVLLGLSTPAAAFSSYAERLSGGSSAPVKPASYAPGGGRKPQAPVGRGPSSYLDNVAGGAPAPAASNPQAAAPPSNGASAPAYMQQPPSGGLASSGPKSSYSPFKYNKGQPAPTSGMNSYLNNFAGTAPVSNGASAPSNNGSYTQQVSGGAPAGSMPSSGPKTSYSPFKYNKGQPAPSSGLNSYLNNFSGAAPAQSAAPVANGAPAPSYTGGGPPTGGMGSSAPKSNYSPYKFNKGQPAPSSGMNSYLNNFSGSSAPAQSRFAEVQASPADAASYSSGGYQQVGGGGMASAGPRTSYAPTKSHKGQPTRGSGMGGYLAGM